MNYFSGPSHLGDIIWALIWLRKIPGEHHFYCPEEYHWQLTDVVEGKSITIHPNVDIPTDAQCTRIGCNRFSGITWAMQPDLVPFLMLWGNAMCKENGVEPQFNSRQDMLADWLEIDRHHDVGDFDALCHQLSPVEWPVWKDEAQ